MSISIQITTEQLQQPGVSEALSELIQALGGTAAPAASSSQAPEAPLKRRGRPPKAKPAPSAPEKKITSLGGLLNEVSEQSRNFLEGLQERDELNMSQAMELLGLTERKAVGGIVGGISRRARKHGLFPPFRNGHNAEGERLWKWTGDIHTKPEPLPAPKKKRKGRPKKSESEKAAAKPKKRGRPRKKS